MAELLHLDVKELMYNSLECLNLSIPYSLNPKCAKNMLWIHFIVVYNNHDSLAEMVH